MLKASNNVPRTTIVRVNLELTIMTMPSTAGKVQTSILIKRIAKPILTSGIIILKIVWMRGIHASANLSSS